MFPEPISAIGFVLSCVSFLLSSLSSLDQRRRQILECRDFLVKFSRQLADLQSKYEGWRLVWGGLSREKYILAWGSQTNFDLVLAWTTDIKDQFQRIEQEVRGKQRDQLRRVVDRICQNLPGGQQADLDDDDLQWWRVKIERIHDQSSASLTNVNENVRSTEIGYRIAFSLFKNETLEKSLVALDKTVTYLDTCTTREYSKLRWTNTKDRPIGDELTQSLRLQQLLENSMDFGKTLFEDQSRKNQQQGNMRPRLWTLDSGHPVSLEILQILMHLVVLI
jgi:hypothetical protein